MGLVCHLLAGEGHGNLQTYCPQFCGNQTLLYSQDPAEHLHFVNPCNFRTLDRFKHSWLATATDIWNQLPANMILQGEASGWRTILKDACAALYMHLTCTAILYVFEFITEKSYLYQHSYLLLQQYSSLQVNLISFYQLHYSPCVDDPLVSYKTICSIQYIR